MGGSSVIVLTLITETVRRPADARRQVLHAVHEQPTKGYRAVNPSQARKWRVSCRQSVTPGYHLRLLE